MTPKETVTREEEENLYVVGEERVAIIKSERKKSGCGGWESGKRGEYSIGSRVVGTRTYIQHSIQLKYSTSSVLYIEEYEYHDSIEGLRYTISDSKCFRSLIVINTRT
jgi:hypothetical protein